MPIQRHVLRSAALAAALVASAPAFAANEPYGVWMNDTGRGAIEIKDCGGKLCGQVVWVKDPAADAKGCGREIITNAVATGDGVWGGDEARIYSPEKKKTYNVEITPLKDGTLKVKGYAGISFLSKTMIWTKAPADLVRCSTQEAAAKPAPNAPAAPAPATEANKPAGETQAAPAEKAAPPADEKDVAEAEKDGVDIEGIVGDVFTRKDGKCKVDTPWVKLDFDCKDKEEEPGQK